MIDLFEKRIFFFFDLKDLKQILIAASTTSAPKFRKKDFLKLLGNKEDMLLDKAAIYFEKIILCTSTSFHFDILS